MPEEKIDLYESLTKRCTKDKIVAQTLCADIYKIENISNGVTSEQEIHHIRIPFDEQKEQILAAKYDINEDALKDFYTQFRASLQVCNKINRFLAANNSPSVTRYTRFILVTPNHTDKDSNTNDIYFMYDGFEEPLIGSDHITQEGAKKSQILELGLELLEMVKLYESMGFCVGAFDLNFMSNAKMGLKNYFFMVSQSSGETYKVLPSKVYTTHMKPSVANGHEPTTAASDIYSVCSLLWGMLQGTHFDLPHKENEPTCISKELIEELRRGLKGKGSLRDLKYAITAELDKKDSDEYIAFSKPEYQDAVDTIKAKTKEQQKKAETEEKKEKKRREKKESAGKKLNKKDLFGWLGVLILVIGAALIWKFSNPSATPNTAEPSNESSTITETAAEDVRTSESERLYTYNGTVVDYYGVPSGRYSVNENGDIVTVPSSYPQSLDELVAKKTIIDLSKLEQDINMGEITLTAEQMKEYSIAHDSIVRQNGVLKIVYAIYDDADQTSIVCLADPYMSDVYENMDDELYNKLLLLSKEAETETLYEHTTTANGTTTTIYYDADGKSHSEDEWLAQEQLKEQISLIKEEMAAYKLSSGEEVVVPANGVEEYVYVESINFAKDKYTITLDTYSYGMLKDTLFLIQASVMPSNATNKEVEFAISPTGANIPYAYNGQIIMGDYSTYDYINSAVFDFSNGDDGSSLSIVIMGMDYGDYELSAKCMAGSAYRKVTMTLTDEEGYTEDITEESVEEPIEESETEESSSAQTAETENSKPTEESSKPEESSVPKEESKPTESSEQKAESSKQESESSQQQTSTPPTESSTEKEESPTPAPQPAPEPAAPEPVVIPEIEEIAFSVYPAAVTLKVGESVDLCPSDSCRWSSTNPAVATMGGAQARTVYGISAGSCSIVCTSSSGQTVYVSVTVTD